MESLVRARQIGLGEGLDFVYTGNVPDSGGESTVCPACGAVVVERRGFTVTRIALRDGRCNACGERIAGRGLP
jgi:pyruvate formate lyase activating enzyme